MQFTNVSTTTNATVQLRLFNVTTATAVANSQMDLVVPFAAAAGTKTTAFAYTFYVAGVTGAATSFSVQHQFTGAITANSQLIQLTVGGR